MYHSIRIKIVVETKIPSACKNVLEASEVVKSNIEKGSRDWICLASPNTIEPLKLWLADYFKDTATIRDGVSNGCYGSTDGIIHEGITLYLDPLVFPERWIETEEDGSKSEGVNIAMLLHNHAELVESEDIESVENVLEALGLEAKADNTYNYLGNSEDEPCTLQDVDFRAYSKAGELEGATIVVLKFHCGGDPRGNYTQEYIYKFEDAWDFYTVFMPSCELLEDKNN